MMKRILISALLLCLIAFSVTAQDLTTFILVRHAEKGKDDPRNPSLSALGKERAAHLNDMLSPMEISAIYSTPFKRTQETVAAIGQSKSLDVMDYDYQNANLLNELLEKHAGGTILISGHSNTTPVLVNQLLGEEKFGWLKEDEYDKIFIVTVSKIGNGKLSLLSY